MTSNVKRVVISSTEKNGKIIAQQVVYKGEGTSVTRHEKIKQTPEGNINILEGKSWLSNITPVFSVDKAQGSCYNALGHQHKPKDKVRPFKHSE